MRALHLAVGQAWFLYCSLLCITTTSAAPIPRPAAVPATSSAPGLCDPSQEKTHAKALLTRLWANPPDSVTVGGSSPKSVEIIKITGVISLWAYARKDWAQPPTNTMQIKGNDDLKTKLDKVTDSKSTVFWTGSAVGQGDGTIQFAPECATTCNAVDSFNQIVSSIKAKPGVRNVQFKKGNPPGVVLSISGSVALYGELTVKDSVDSENLDDGFIALMEAAAAKGVVKDRQSEHWDYADITWWMQMSCDPPDPEYLAQWKAATGQ